jgi:hypothetical protein
MVDQQILDALFDGWSLQSGMRNGGIIAVEQ